MPYAIGLKNFVAAKQLTDDESGATYDEVKSLSEGISVSLEPNVATGRLFGDNRTVATASKFNYAGVTINPTSMSAEDEVLLLGKELGEDGVLRSKGEAPYVAFGFEVTMDDGSSEYWWLLKGKFQEPSRTNNTGTDSIEFGTPTINGEFIPRNYDGEWKFVGSDSNENFTAGDTWFDQVYDPNDATP